MGPLTYNLTWPRTHPQVLKEFAVTFAQPHPLGGVNWARVQNRVRDVDA